MEFQNGKIYTIRSHQTNRYYIGSTNHKTLAQRLGKHRGNYKDYLNNNNGYMSSFEVLQYTDHYIELLELYPCNTKDELHRREGELIREFKSDVVNIIINCRTQLEYRQDNIERIKQRYVDNSEHYKQYRLNNKERMKEFNRNYCKLKHTCDCGLVLAFKHLKQHLERSIHPKLIQQLFNNELNHYNF